MFLAAGCAGGSRSADSTQEYRAFLMERSGASLSPAREKKAVAAFKNYLSHMTRESVLHDTGRVYAPDVFFNDTLKTIHGSKALEEYFLGTVENTDEVKVEFTDVARSGDNYYFRWVMDVKFRKFRRGETIRTIGMTHVRFNSAGQVILHQDYWDSAQGLFEYVPVIGGGIRLIKARL